MRISDWSSDVCSSDLPAVTNIPFQQDAVNLSRAEFYGCCQSYWPPSDNHDNRLVKVVHQISHVVDFHTFLSSCPAPEMMVVDLPGCPLGIGFRSEERRVGEECVSTCRFRW